MTGIEHDILQFVYHYRYFGLYILLSLGMIGIPVPDEFIMVFSGFQTSLGNMSLPQTIVAASLGSFTGMNLSYAIGRQLDIHLVRRIKYFGIDKKAEKAETWFARYGDALIVIGYFFSGFRHFTAYFAGMSKSVTKNMYRLFLWAPLSGR
jgi:membrane protein DedA with SNARE-associated domain